MKSSLMASRVQPRMRARGKNRRVTLNYEFLRTSFLAQACLVPLTMMLSKANIALTRAAPWLDEETFVSHLRYEMIGLTEYAAGPSRPKHQGLNTVRDEPGRKIETRAASRHVHEPV